MIIINIGQKITNLKNERGLSTNKLAIMSGIAQSALRSIELGEKSPTIDTLSRILNALGVTFAEFFAEPAQQAVLPTTQDLETIKKIKDLPPDRRKAVEILINYKEQAASNEEVS